MVVTVRFPWVGDPGGGSRLLDQVRTVAPALLDDAIVKPYATVDSVHADPVDPLQGTTRPCCSPISPTRR